MNEQSSEPLYAKPSLPMGTQWPEKETSSTHLCNKVGRIQFGMNFACCVYKTFHRTNANNAVPVEGNAR